MFPRSAPDLVVEPLATIHNRAAFSSGDESLDRYFRTQAGQDTRHKANGVFVLTARTNNAEVLGYYTLCATALTPGDVPESVRRFLPRYPLVSATLLGRLAVSRHCQGQGLGALLLADGLKRVFASADTVGSSMLVVDALNAAAVAFYLKQGFVQLHDSQRLILPMRTIAKLLQT